MIYVCGGSGWFGGWPGAVACQDGQDGAMLYARAAAQR